MQITRKEFSRVPFVTINRIGEGKMEFGKTLNEPSYVRDFWRDVIAKRDNYEPEKENLYVILLNTKLKPIGVNLVSLGSVNESIAHPREILRPAIAMGAYAIILGHNHPTGDSSPSNADEKVTSKLKTACDIMSIYLMDHFIYGEENNYFSFKSSGML